MNHNFHCGRIGFVLALFCTAWFAGCAIGPDYKRPAIDTPAQYRSDSTVTGGASVNPAWWQIYNDPVLQALIREALTNNYDVRIALTRVEQARAVAMQARSQFVPHVDYGGTVSRGRNDLLSSIYPNNGTTINSVGTVLNASWELDLWGRIRRLNESARAQFLASEEARRAIRLSLLSDVASDYFQLLDLDQELAIANRTTNSFGESLKLFTQRLEGGTASVLETSRAQAALDDVTATVPETEEQILITENALCVLLGRNPGPINRAGSTLDAVMPPDVPAGLPSSLLEDRPDVREAEQLLRSANAQIGESAAEFLPKIGLTALLGKVSTDLSAFTLGTANAWGIGADAAGPLFEGGRLVGQYRQSKAARDEARLEYQQTILNAFREVSDALITRQKLVEIRDRQADEVAALGTSVKTSTERYHAGKASYYEVLEAQQELFPSELNLTRTQRDQLIAVVDLYKALGGGWNDEQTNSGTTAP